MSKQHQVKIFEVYTWMKEGRDCTLQFANYTGITDHTSLKRTLTLALIWVAEISAVCILSSAWSIGIKQFLKDLQARLDSLTATFYLFSKKYRMLVINMV